MECSICLNPWDSVTHIPRLIPCGHTFCQPCIILLVQKHKSSPFPCSLCQRPTSIFEASQVFELIKNFTLLSATGMTASPAPTSQLKKQPNVTSLQEQRKVSRKTENSNPPKVLVLQKCARHNQILQYWDTQTREVFCGMCVEQLSFKERENCQILSQVAQQIRRRISDTRELIRLRKIELNKVEIYLKDERRKVPERANKALSAHLTALKAMVSQVEDTLRQKLTQKTSKNQTTFKNLLEEVDKVKAELVGQQEILEGLSSNNDEEIMEMWDQLQEITVKTRHFEVNDLFDFGEADIAIRAPQELFTQIRGYLAKAIVIEESEPHRFGKEVKPSSIIRNKHRDWLCLHCQQVLAYSSLSLQMQSKYSVADVRNSGTFVHCRIYCTTLCLRLLKKSSTQLGAEKWKSKSLWIRNRLKKQEKRFGKPDSKTRYVVSEEWMTQWKMFILNKEVKNKAIQPRMSLNPDVGILPPPPLSNLSLLLTSPHGYSVRPGLVNTEDYRIINQHVWHQLVRIYEGGPPIYTRTGHIADAKVKQSVRPERKNSRPRNYSPFLTQNSSPKLTKDSTKFVGIKRVDLKMPPMKKEGRDASRSMRNIFDKAGQPSVRGRSVRIPQHKQSKNDVMSFRTTTSESNEDEPSSSRESHIARRNIFSKY